MLLYSSIFIYIHLFICDLANYGAVMCCGIELISYTGCTDCPTALVKRFQVQMMVTSLFLSKFHVKTAVKNCQNKIMQIHSDL